MAARRIVKITTSFEADIDAQLPEERGADGQPSRLDFLLYELPTIMEVFATRYDQLPNVAGAPPNVKSFVGRGTLVAYYFVAGKLTEDATVELQLIDIEIGPRTDEL